MLKYFLNKNVSAFFFIFLFTSLFSFAQNNSAKQDGLKGNVKSCEEFWFSGGSYERHFYLYDERGRKIKQVINYRGKNNVDSCSFHYSISGDTITERESWKKHKMDSSISIYENGLLKAWKFIYHNPLHPEQERNFFYENNLLVSDSFIQHGFFYGKKVVEKFSYDSNGFLVRKEIQTHYTLGLPNSEFTIYYPDSVGNDTAEFRNRHGYTEKISRKFDKYGNVTSYKKTDGKGKILSEFAIRYEYDEQGNWIKSSKVYGSKEYYPPSSSGYEEVTTRRISYY